MAKGNRAVRVGLLLLLASCTAPGARKDLSAPITVDDMTPLPAQVTAENAREVVRKCLQRHRRDATDVHHKYGYAFRESGFVQFYRFNPIDRGNREKLARVYVDFAAVESARASVEFDSAMFRDRYRVTLRGRFRKWEAFFNPYRPQPAVGEEPSTVEVDEISLVLTEALCAKRLAEALDSLR